MKQILSGTSRRVGDVFHEMDVNFIEVCNSILRIAYPEKTLQNYADDNNEPADPVTDNCYLVSEDSTVWGLDVEKNHIISWNGEAWEVLPHKITELSVANMAITTPPGMEATTLQAAINELAAAVFSTGSVIPMTQTNLNGLGLSYESIDARLNYFAENLVAPASVDIRGNDNPTAASAAARQTLFDNGIFVDYNDGYNPNA